MRANLKKALNSIQDASRRGMPNDVAEVVNIGGIAEFRDESGLAVMWMPWDAYEELTKEAGEK